MEPKVPVEAGSERMKVLGLEIGGSEKSEIGKMTSFESKKKKDVIVMDVSSVHGVYISVKEL